MSVHEHRSLNFSCPHCGKVCDSNTGTADRPDDKSVGICIDCIQPFWLIVKSRSPLSFRTEKISAAEYDEFSEYEKKSIADYQSFLEKRSSKKKRARSTRRS